MPSEFPFDLLESESNKILDINKEINDSLAKILQGTKDIKEVGDITVLEPKDSGKSKSKQEAAEEAEAEKQKVKVNHYEDLGL